MELAIACRSLVCFAWLTFVGFVRAKTTVTQPSIYPVYIKSGDSLELMCEQSNGFKVLWSKGNHTGNREYQLIDSSTSTGFVTIAYVNGKYFLKLMKSNVVVEDSGSYKCAVGSGTDMPFAVDVHVLKVDERPGLITNAGNTTTLGCILSSSDVRASFRWFRNEKEIVGDSRKYTINTSFSENTTESELTIKNVVEADIGIYNCFLELNNGNKYNQSVNLYSYPQVKPVGRSKNGVEGGTLELVCKTWGWPTPNVTWERQGGHLASDKRVTTFPDGTPKSELFPNGTLTLRDMAANDRAIYVCISSSFVNNSTQETNTTILVRVKGKLAPILPLVGIVLEMVVLFVIIYFYERNRAQMKAEQERRETTENQTNSIAQVNRQGGGRENMRLRK